MSVTTDRLHRLRVAMSERDLPAALISNVVNIGYLTGFTGSTAALLVTRETALFITDSRYALRAAAECPEVERHIIASSAGYQEATIEATSRLASEKLAFEADFLTVAQLQSLQEALREKLPTIELTAATGLVGDLRKRKDSVEIAATREACALADRGFEQLLTLLRPGAQERDVALELDYWLRKHGSERAAFEIIIASGPNAARPHHTPGARELRPGDTVIADFGAVVGGYVSDITRTVVLGEATDRQREVYGAVLDANRAAIAAIHAGASGTRVDAVARDLIRDRGFGDYFGHGLGHGIGRVVHDHQALSPKQDVELAAGMIITVEPGIYIEGWGGVRVEDDVLVTPTGCEVLTHAHRELLELT